ncbi:unnamed protein product [Psylliodes chrysocephalus]|uniref:Uncharacterized protein n=1 Tax=Psylliodes chrysocephalus TaxID=3402493 RepID=A0A9P0GH29_9CUCU|nr:unnamed protein product [Psylliodes chrysocephala]
MIVIKSLVVFAVLALVHSDNADETTLLNVWKCIKPKLHAGIPEIDVPSYDPYLLPFNLTFGAEIIVFKRFFIVNHILVYGLLDADLQIKQLSKDTDNVASLEWSVDLPSIFIDAFWDSIINTNGTDIQTHGKMNMTLTDAHFEGILNIEKPLFKGSITEYKITKNSVADAVDMPQDEIVKKYSFVKNFQTTELGCKKEWSQESIALATERRAIEWYTEGSKTIEGTGIGVYGPRTKQSESLGK